MKANRPSAARLARGSALLAMLALAACRTTPEAAEAGAKGTPERGAEAGIRGPALAVVYFDYDSAALRSDAPPVIQKNADALRGAPDAVVTLEGHCDERGSEEYNLALGEKRGEAVRAYLIDLGIPASRLRVVSFGSAKPAVMGHDETAWRWNRRVESR